MQKYLFYQQNPAILTFLTKCNFKNFMLWKWKLSIFEKQLFLSITFPFIDDFTLIIDEINDFWKFWPLMTFFGLHWPFWPLWPWTIFLSKNPIQNQFLNHCVNSLLCFFNIFHKNLNNYYVTTNCFISRVLFNEE